jgi:hypothetical protein
LLLAAEENLRHGKRPGKLATTVFGGPSTARGAEASTVWTLRGGHGEIVAQVIFSHGRLMTGTAGVERDDFVRGPRSDSALAGPVHAAGTERIGSFEDESVWKFRVKSGLNSGSGPPGGAGSSRCGERGRRLSHGPLRSVRPGCTDAPGTGRARPQSPERTDDGLGDFGTWP